MDIGTIALIIFALIGVLMYFAPAMCVRADAKDDPDALAKIKKAGLAVMGFSVAAVLFMLRHS